MLIYCASVFVLFLGLGAASPVKNEIDLRMPNAKPLENDTYFCHSIEMTEDPIYITEFIPEAQMEIAHHVLLYGCEEPGSHDNLWTCGEMKAKTPQAPVCKSGTKIIYAWAMGAPKLKLPKDVSFEVGGNTNIKYLVLQIHYKNAKPFLPPSKKTDNSGIKMRTQTTPTPKLAGVYILGTGGVIPAKSQVFMDVACTYTGKSVLHPFAYRVHTHSHGVVVSGYRVRDGEWKQLGKEDPQKPQMFYKSKNEMTVKPGDNLAARCIMDNQKGAADVSIGSTQADEMCNFYMMYWVDAKDAAQLEDSSNTQCWSAGFPAYNWAKNELLGDIPNEASMMSDMKTMLEMSPEAEKIAEEVNAMQQSQERMMSAMENEFFPMERRSEDFDDVPSYYDDDAQDWE